MKLIALLCWYDEPTWPLVELVASLGAAGVDELVAVDGAYALYPGGRPRSRSDQAQAMLAAAEGYGMGFTLHVPRDLWLGNEVEKRTFAFAAGALAAQPGVDWFWVIDGDEVVVESLGLREALARTELDAGEVILDQIMDTGHEGQVLMRQLFRAQPDPIRLIDNHFTYWTADGRMLCCHYRNPPELEPAESLHFVRVEHRQTNRPPARMEARKRLYAEPEFA